MLNDALFRISYGCSPLRIAAAGDILNILIKLRSLSTVGVLAVGLCVFNIARPNPHHWAVLA